jgi:transposase
LEVERPKRKHRTRGKSDSIDAELAARGVLSGGVSLTPKTHDGHAEMIRALTVARRSALKSRTQAANQLRGLLVTAPEDLRSSFAGHRLPEVVARASRLRPDRSPSDVVGATKLALRSIAKRYRHLSSEISELDAEIRHLVSKAAPELLALNGVGPDVAASLLVAAGDNPHRLGSESSFAALCGVSLIPASSGKTQRHRLNRLGNRQANRALYVIAMCRMSHCERTREYVARRTSEGLGKKEIIRCLKRYIAREVYKTLKISSESS